MRANFDSIVYNLLFLLFLYTSISLLLRYI